MALTHEPGHEPASDVSRGSNDHSAQGDLLVVMQRRVSKSGCGIAQSLDTLAIDDETMLTVGEGEALLLQDAVPVIGAKRPSTYAFSGVFRP
jgi:hypothetical protein